MVIAGTFAIADSLYHLYESPVPYTWTVLALLTLFSGTFSIRVPSIPATISVSETFVFTAVLLFGTAPATIIVALDGLIISLSRKKREPHRVLFNGAEPAISIWLSAHLFFALSGSQPLSQHSDGIAPLVVPLIALTIAYFLLNSWLTAIAVWFETGISAGKVWRQHFLWLSLNYFGGASVAILLARNTTNVDYSALSVIIPLLITSYLTFKTALQRVEDARAHVTELNKLYLSTIETFAMWIDAKDQVTHGHIRRVQGVAVALARQLGVRDEKLIKAIEAAALLHDMGKLAVPEHILNKPGKLTAGEFEKMKLHASVGAQILSAIDFPYPVVPIVRHHHENWDGTGYPDRLAGTDIPIGARILSVVDCFDALTSDRPYRPRLSSDQAIAILLDRRGSMYDPLVVDGFMEVHGALQSPEGDAEAEDSERQDGESCLSATPIGSSTPAALDNHGEEVLALYELSRSLAGRAGLRDTCEVILSHLSDLFPASLSVFFLYRPDTDDLVAAHATGAHADVVKGGRLRPGNGISGWVAANRCTARDADPRLELAKLQFPSPAGLNRAHSVPLLLGGSLLGVLTFYYGPDKRFSAGRSRALELLTPHISVAVQEAAEYDKQQGSRLRDRLTGLPRFEAMAALVADRGSQGDSYPLVVTFIDVNNLKWINRRHGQAVGDAVLVHVVNAIKSSLRSGDLLLRYDGDEFVVLLSDSEASTGEAVATRLASTLSPCSFRLPGGMSISVGLAIGYAVAPIDGITLAELVEAAKERAVSGVLPAYCAAVH